MDTHRLIRAAAPWALVLLAAVCRAQVPVAVPSLDRQADGRAIVQPGFWFFAAGAPPQAPAMLLLHGCGGPYARGRQVLSERFLSYAKLLNALGIHALVSDSLTPRGEVELCTQRVGSRSITQRERRLDALGALQWMALQPGVDPARLGLMGWSHGGSAVLAATGADHETVRAAPQQSSLAIAYYPGCSAELKAGYRPSVPLLMLVGLADDWTPAAPCLELARRANGAPVQVEAYAGAYHGFDSTVPVRLRADVPNGVYPGRGVHVGGDSAALAASRVRLEAFLRQRWSLP